MSTGTGTTTSDASYYFCNNERVAQDTVTPPVPPAVDPTHEVLFFHSDHLGSASVMTDETGTPKQELQYYPYGGTRQEWNDPGSATLPKFNGEHVKHRFTGHERDFAIGIYYAQQRYYDQRLARFISPDPVGPDLADPQSLNPYAYCRNNPVKYVDPTGQEAEDTKNKLWYDKLSDWSKDKAKVAKDYYNDSKLNTGLMGSLAVTALNTGIDVVAGFASVPSSIGHVGEGLGTFSADPSWENAPAALNDIGTIAGVLAAGAGGLPSAKLPLWGKGAGAAGGEATQLSSPKTRPIRDIIKAGEKDAHHVIQDATVKDLPGYNTKMAPGVKLAGGGRGTPHHAANRVQAQAGGGTFGAETRIGYKAMRRAGIAKEEARQIITETVEHFKELGVTKDTVTKIPNNRRPK